MYDATFEPPWLKGPGTKHPSHFQSLPVTYCSQRGTGRPPSCPAWRRGAGESNHCCLSPSALLLCHNTPSPGLGDGGVGGMGVALIPFP